MAFNLNRFMSEEASDAQRAEMEQEAENATWRDTVPALFVSVDHTEYSIEDMKDPITWGAIDKLAEDNPDLFKAEFDINDKEAVRKGVMDYIIKNQETLVRGENGGGGRFKSMTEAEFMAYMADSEAKAAERQAEKENMDSTGGTNDGPGPENQGDSQNPETVKRREREARAAEREAARQAQASVWKEMYESGSISPDMYRRHQVLDMLAGSLVNGQGTFSALTDPNNYLHSSCMSYKGRRAAKRLMKLNKQYEELSEAVASQQIKDYNKILGMSGVQGEMIDKKSGPGGILSGLASRVGGLFNKNRDNGPSEHDMEQEHENDGEGAEKGEHKPFTLFMKETGGKITNAFTSARDFLDQKSKGLKSNGTVIGLVTGSALFAMAHPLRFLKDTGHNIKLALDEAVERNKNGQEKTAEEARAMYTMMIDPEYGAGTDINPEFVKNLMPLLIASAQKTPEAGKALYEQCLRFVTDYQAEAGTVEIDLDFGEPGHEAAPDVETEAPAHDTEPDAETGAPAHEAAPDAETEAPAHDEADGHAAETGAPESGAEPDAAHSVSHNTVVTFMESSIVAATSFARGEGPESDAVAQAIYDKLAPFVYSEDRDHLDSRNTPEEAARLAGDDGHMRGLYDVFRSLKECDESKAENVIRVLEQLIEAANTDVVIEAALNNRAKSVVASFQGMSPEELERDIASYLGRPAPDSDGFDAGDESETLEASETSAATEAEPDETEAPVKEPEPARHEDGNPEPDPGPAPAPADEADRRRQTEAQGEGFARVVLNAAEDAGRDVGQKSVTEWMNVGSDAGRQSQAQTDMPEGVQRLQQTLDKIDAEAAEKAQEAQGDRENV